MTLSPEAAIDAANGAFGRHAGSRALHAKGIVCTATFTPTPAGAELTRAAHLHSGELKATVRFSNAGGNPHHPDFQPDPRGLAVKLYLPDGQRTDIVAVSSPRLPTKTPEQFIALIQAQKPPALGLPLFLARNRSVARALPGLLPTVMPRESYAGITYYGIHAFRWVDAEGTGRFVRYTLGPEFTAAKLPPWKAKKLGPDYLQQELRDRLARGPVGFSLEVTIASPGDPVDDPSAAWPADRRRVVAGQLQITGLDTEREQDGDVLVFDPGRVIDGVELSDDPVLRFRPSAYGESVKRRTS